MLSIFGIFSFKLPLTGFILRFFLFEFHFIEMIYTFYLHEAVLNFSVILKYFSVRAYIYKIL